MSKTKITIEFDDLEELYVISAALDWYIDARLLSRSATSQEDQSMRMIAEKVFSKIARIIAVK